METKLIPLTVTTRATKRKKDMMGHIAKQQSTSLLLDIPDEIAVNMVLKYLSLRSCHHYLPQVSSRMRALVYSRSSISQVVVQIPGKKIPDIWFTRLIYMKYMEKLPPRVNFPKNLTYLVLDGITIKDWAGEVSKKLLDQLQGLVLTKCKIQMFDGIKSDHMENLCFNKSVVHRTTEAGTGNLSFSEIPNLSKIIMMPSCVCMKVQIGELFRSCPKLTSACAPFGFSEMLDPNLHFMPLLTRLHFIKSSDALYQQQADILPRVAPNLESIFHGQASVQNMDFIKQFRSLKRHALILTEP